MADSDIVELNQLAYRYAAAVDACDADLFRSAFHPDARLRVYHPDATEPFSNLVGHEQLVSIPEMMRGMHRHTAHMMTNHLVDIEGDAATGQVLCTARHLSLDADNPTSLNVIIRYVDRYERRDGVWRIADREIRFLWSERHDVVDSGFGGT